MSHIVGGSIFQVDSYEFYGNYYGHKIEHLNIVHDRARVYNRFHEDNEYSQDIDKIKSYQHSSDDTNQRNVIFLIGDSTMDNKNWFSKQAGAVNGYEYILEPPVSKQDISYWLNQEIVNRGLKEHLVASIHVQLL